jgi:hypothetical protein
MKTYFSSVAAIAVLLFSAAGIVQATTPKTSGVFLTADDYKNVRLSFEGDCSSKTHKLELHNVLNKPYIDVTHETEKRRFAKSDLFGFRACDGHDYRFVSNLEYQILESKDLYIYVYESHVSHGKGSYADLEYYFSAGAEGPVLALTKEDLKKSFPDNQRFHEALDAVFGPKKKLSEYDKTHKMFKVNQLLIASRG